MLLRVAPSGSRVVADFLSGSTAAAESGAFVRPLNRRRLDQAETAAPDSSVVGIGVPLQSESSAQFADSQSNVTPAAPNTSHDSAPTSHTVSAPLAQVDANTGSALRQNFSIVSNDPFGYLSTAPQANDTQRQIVSSDPFGYLSAPPQSAYLPPSYQQARGHLSSFPSSAAGPSSGSSRVFISPSTAHLQSPPLGFTFSVSLLNI